MDREGDIRSSVFLGGGGKRNRTLKFEGKKSVVADSETQIYLLR